MTNYLKSVRYLYLIFLMQLFSVSLSIGQNNKELLKHKQSVELPECLIGYTEMQTNLIGGRQANVKTMRAVIIQCDGSQRRVLAERLVEKSDSMTQFAGWSPDGKTAIIGLGWKSQETAEWEELNKEFNHVGGDVLYDNCLVDIETGKVTNVTAVERVSRNNNGLFFWPDDPGKLGFTAIISGISHPFKMDMDGRNKTDLTKGSRDFTYGFNASRDGKRITYHRDYQIYIADADGSNPLHVMTGQKFNFGPQWSPDGKMILFVSGEKNVQSNPCISFSDGSGVRKLADRGGYKGSIEFLDVYDFHGGSSDIPVWAADGRSVYYTAVMDKRVELFQVDLNGGITQLTHSDEGTLHYHPEPSKDGKWLLYGSKRKGVRQLFIMRLTDHKEFQITNLNPGKAAMWAHWQPNLYLQQD